MNTFNSEIIQATISYPDSVIGYLDRHQGFFLVLGSALGWLAIYFVTSRTNSKQLKNSARLEAYKELYSLKLKIDQVSLDLGILLTEFAPPFMEMGWATNKRSLTTDSAYGVWFKYLSRISEEHFKFSGAYLRFFEHVDMWITIIPKAKNSRDILFTELSVLSDKISRHQKYLQDISINEFDWIKWDQEEIKKETEKIGNEFDQIGSAYLSDFIDILHDELVAPVFGNKKIPREDFNYKEAIISKTLTKDGIKEIRYSPTRIAKLRDQAKDIQNKT